MSMFCERYFKLLLTKGHRFDAIRKARDWVATLHQPIQNLTLPNLVHPPRYPVEDLISLVDPDIRRPFNMMEVLIRIVDDSRLLNFKPMFGRNLITAWASVHGELKEARVHEP
jgi:acetyl-CoA carboxylase carboxyltransferase component